ncbi:hypothetical protein [Deinococcus cavernae]|uniref:hypothetical protein n=1 Tax=Deinococcus cavernae TaxID=2320857 RepID=UPI00131443B2|nr:hypothetical protein [Deinococcus cavernae]
MKQSEKQQQETVSVAPRVAARRTPWPLALVLLTLAALGGAAVWQSSRPTQKPQVAKPVKPIQRAPGTVPPPTTRLPTQDTGKVAAPPAGMVENAKVKSQVTDWDKIEQERQAAWAAARARAEAERARARAEAEKRRQEEAARQAAQQAAEAERRRQEEQARAAAQAAQEEAASAPTQQESPRPGAPQIPEQPAPLQPTPAQPPEAPASTEPPVPAIPEPAAPPEIPAPDTTESINTQDIPPVPTSP